MIVVFPGSFEEDATFACYIIQLLIGDLRPLHFVPFLVLETRHGPGVEIEHSTFNSLFGQFLAEGVLQGSKSPGSGFGGWG